MLSLKPFNLLPKFIRNGGALTGLFLIYLPYRAILLPDTQVSMEAEEMAQRNCSSNVLPVVSLELTIGHLQKVKEFMDSA